MAIIQYKMKSQALESKSDILVILPTPAVDEMKKIPDYGTYAPGRKYQTLYLYHGTTGDCWDWLRFSRIESYAEKHNVAVVMPTVLNSNFHDISGSYAYFTYVTKEVPKVMEFTFPLSRKRENKFIAGLSMGGSGVFKAAMDNPQDYAAVASLSGGFHLHEMIDRERKSPWAAAYKPDEILTGTLEDPFWQAQQVMAQKIDYPRLYLCCGTEDEICGEANLRFKAHLDKIGMRYTWHTQPGGHDWDFWDDEIQRVLKWLPLTGDLVEE